MEQRILVWTAIAVVAAVLLAAAVTLTDRDVAPAPAFALTSTGYEDGVQGQPVNFTLADYRGKVVVLDFMAVACTTCRAVTEDVLKPLAERHSDVVFLSIDTWSDPGSGNLFGGEDDEDLIDLQQATNVSWRHARDTDDVYLKYTAWSLPKLAVVDPDGDLVYSHVGTQRLSRVEAAVEAAELGTATPVPSLRLGVVGLAFVAGLACVVTPCGIGLLPAYLALLVEDGARQAPPRRVARAVVGGLSAAFGIAAVYAVLAGVAWIASDALRAALPWLGPLLGIVLFALGAMSLAGADWSAFTRRLPFAIDGRKGFAAFGAAYAVAGFACTGPLFLPLLVTGFAQGASTGLLTLGAYTVAVAAVVVFAALLVAAGEQTLLRRLLAHTVTLHRVGAVVLMLGGLYLAWYAAKAYGVV